MSRSLARFWRNSALAAALCLGAPVAGGTEPAHAPTVVLVTNHADAPIVPRLRAELVALGMQVEEEDRVEGELLPRDLSETARRHRAIAAFRLRLTEGTVEIWVADRVTGKVVLREVVHRGSDNIDDMLVVLRAVELLRGSLMELEAPHPSRGELKPTPEVRVVTGYPEAKERFSLLLGPAVMVMSGVPLVAPGATAELGYRPVPHFGLRVGTGAALSPARLHDSAGTVELIPRWLEIGATWLPLDPAYSLRPMLGLGIALLETSLRGFPKPSYTGSSRSVLEPAATACLGLGYRLSRNILLGVRTWGALERRSTTILVAGHPAAERGRLTGAGTLGLEAVWP